MAKNTGRGSRAGAVSGRTQVKNAKTGMWTKRDSTTGRFLQAKTSGGTFKGVSKEK
ncbi:hypothetical protein FHR75_003938 [Kineococcus radiotolerans]|jgi:hypothetical protein|uniref:Uncharacterized protein n=1 Tax=Kineococcus radiotolerans TaxID=131568 RepID=A0A7W4TQ78_KINRA|nr:hypothetical protein [Kineococcus radiotolerans]MBB2903096.1 hypothetical protein [Kineococcus radiotolerans]